MSFFVSESIKNLVDEDSFANQFNNSSIGLKFFLYTKDVLIFETSSFETIEFENSDLKSICFSVNQKLISNLFLKNNLILKIDTDESSLKKYEVEIINITNINDDNYYCKFNIL
jgi:hypothetical protein